MNRKFLTQFLNKISNFPKWVKEIIYFKLSQEVENEAGIVYEFAQYKPVLTYKGRCELEFKRTGLDSNIYNILNFADKDLTISEISFNTYLSLEETSKYFLLCTEVGYLEAPENSQIINLAGFLAGKLRTGEYFCNSGKISQLQLEAVVAEFNINNHDKKFGQTLVDKGMVSEKQLSSLLTIKQEAGQRFILDYNEIPQIQPACLTQAEEYQKEIEDLKSENRLLKTKLDQLLALVKNDDE